MTARVGMPLLAIVLDPYGSLEATCGTGFETCARTGGDRVATPGHAHREQRAVGASREGLVACGLALDTLPADASLWPARVGDYGGITSGTFYGNLQRYFRIAGLPPAGVHIFRHTAAKLRRDVGESIEDVSAFLDHSSLAVTTVYLRRLEGQEDRTWSKVAEGSLRLTPALLTPPLQEPTIAPHA